ncbi:MAG TPA: bifunctional helix-turn-helix transcriptional regulator/GNAT family N-acetyltransferase [Bryobacteraceae bacterium]|nr:bifunctional helix-turn-helix transcriptional regulator/GNAT family N-acetyltransferase [Bryobacteraceae bacterium]
MPENPVEAIRRFNRFYTRKIGLLGEGHLDSPFSLTEVRVLYELAHRDGAVAAEIGKDLGLDPGYLSRILQRFRKRGLVARTRSKKDARQSRLALTAKGKAVFRPLDRAANREIGALWKQVPPAERPRVVEAMRVMAQALRGEGEPAAAVMLRPHRPGDIGWVVHRHGILYAQEQGWDERFEAVVAEIAARFVHNFDPQRERCWIAERAGEILGSVFLVRESDTVARLRLLLVEPSARGLGLGKRLVDECIGFARRARYRQMVLLTESTLKPAQHIYEKAGFRLVEEKEHWEFGIPVIGQTWQLEL